MTYIPSQIIIINNIARNAPGIGEKYFALVILGKQDFPYCIIQQSTGAIIGSYFSPFFALSAYQEITRLFRYNDCKNDEKSFKIVEKIINQAKETEHKNLTLRKYWVL